MGPPLAAPALLVPLMLLSGGCLFQNGQVGESGTDYLQGSKYTRMLIEVDHQEGKSPRADALNLLKARAAERCNKSGGIDSVLESFSSNESSWTVDELRAAERAHRDSRSSGNTAVLYVQYVGGGYAGDTSQAKVLGVAYSASSIALFKDSIDSTEVGLGPIPLFSTADVEKSVVVHEFGHVLGLVNNGLPMVNAHEDPDHPKHSTNKDSVMYYAVESDAIAQVFSGPPPTQFDNNDIADMKRGGGR